MTPYHRLLITGGTGSFGQAMTRHLLTHGLAEQVVILSRDELKQVEMRAAFQDDPRLRFFLGDVRDRERLMLAFRSCDVVIHAAALKQVPAGEYNPSEFIRTNILGTENVLLAASAAGVERTVTLSSDKAAAPINLYGVSKACMEHLTRTAQHYAGPSIRYACLRYGNVSGSRGSVIPFWRGLLAQGDTILPVTDPRHTRFWFAMPNVVRFCWRAIQDMEGGELRVPKLPTFKVTDLALALGADGTRTIGERGGEKCHESMVTRDEAHYFEDAGPDFLRRMVPAGETLPEGFEYRTDTNPDVLTVEQLREELKSV